MIIFLYGPDDYRRVEKKRSLIAEFARKRLEIGLGVFDFEEKATLEDLDEFLKTQSIFETTKLAVLEHAFDIDAAKLAKLVKPFVGEKNITIVMAERDKPPKALAFLLEKPVISQRFDQLAGEEWLAVVKAEAKKNDVKLTDAAVHFLGAVYEGDTWGLVTELQKLGGFARPALDTAGGRAPAKPIDQKDLDIFDFEVAPNYWGLINSLKSYDIKHRLFAFETMLASNDPPAKIFNILASQWQEKIPHMAEYDLAVKSGKVDYEEALVDLLIS
jgi:DNA polymerase III delta subunit